jgi:hypothetical protein
MFVPLCASREVEVDGRRIRTLQARIESIAWGHEKSLPPVE